jgi:hypothetical protein
MNEQPPSDEELRARLEEELKKITVEDILLQTVVTLVNLGGQRLGLTEETREARDLGQVRVAIEAVRAMMPLLEDRGDVIQPLRDALSQLQLAYAREAQEQAPEQQEPAPEQPQRPSASGRLWTPPGSAG